MIARGGFTVLAKMRVSSKHAITRFISNTQNLIKMKQTKAAAEYRGRWGNSVSVHYLRIIIVSLFENIISVFNRAKLLLENIVNICPVFKKC